MATSRGGEFKLKTGSGPPKKSGDGYGGKKVPCGPGHEMKDQTLAKLGLKRIDDGKIAQLVVIKVKGFDGLNVYVTNAVVTGDDVMLDGVPVAPGTEEPDFTMLPSQCCPVAQRQIRTAGCNAQYPGGAWGIQEFPEGFEDPHDAVMRTVAAAKEDKPREIVLVKDQKAEVLDVEAASGA